MKVLRQYIRHLLIIERITQEDYEDVEATARLAHLGQKRRDGTDYINHPLEVMEITKKHYPNNYAAHLLAMMHDTIEDGPKLGHITVDELKDFIRGSITDPRDYFQIMAALNYMTHDKQKHPNYADYLSHVFSNKLAAIVKISDLIHNLTNNPAPRQVQKYKTALSVVRLPAGLQKSQVNELMSILGVKNAK